MVILKCNPCLNIEMCKPVSVLPSYSTITSVSLILTSPASIKRPPPHTHTAVCCCTIYSHTVSSNTQPTGLQTFASNFKLNKPNRASHQVACVIWLPRLWKVCGIMLILSIEISYAGNRDTTHRTDTMRGGEREGKPLHQIPCRQEGWTREEWPAALTALSVYWVSLNNDRLGYFYSGQLERCWSQCERFVRISFSYLQRERVFFHRVRHVSASRPSAFLQD